MNDAGKVAFTPKGDYSSKVTYEYLDTVVFNRNAYAALRTTTGNAPTDSDTDENWVLLARGGESVPLASETAPGVVKASNDIGVSDDGSMVLKTDFTAQESLAELTSGESKKTFFGKIAKAVADFILHKSTEASTTDYGHTILEDSIESTSTDKAATSASVKKAYDLANEAVPTANISQSSAITETGTHVLDAVEKNASVEGTLAYDIAELNSNLSHIGMIIHSTTLDTMDKVIKIYGGTKWVKIEGRFLLGQSSSYAINSTGGSATHLHDVGTLTLPFALDSNRFLFKLRNANGVTTTLTNSVIGTGQQGNISFSSKNKASIEGTTGNASTMPPYKTVYIWERIE